MDFNLINGDTFDLSSPRYSITDITVATGNAPHKHSHIEHIFHRNGYEWELIEEDDGLRRGSARYYLVDGETHVEFSRTGLEQAGNHIMFENGTSDAFINHICRELFRVMATVEYPFISVDTAGDIAVDIDRDDTEAILDGMRGNGVPNEDLTESQKQMYLDYFDALVDVIEEFDTVSTVEELQTIVSNYRDRRRDIRDSYSTYDTSPKMFKEVLPTIEHENWDMPDMDSRTANMLTIVVHESFDYEMVVTDDYVELVYNKGFDINDDETLFKEEYETEDELRSLINRGFESVEESGE